MYELSGLVTTISVASNHAQLSELYSESVYGVWGLLESFIVKAVWFPSSAFVNSPINFPLSVVVVELPPAVNVAAATPLKCESLPPW